MRKNKTILLSILCSLLLVCTAVLGTIAYLTSRDSITNTFTVGQVNINLDETVVDEDGNPVNENGEILTKPEDYLKTEEGNVYHLIPGLSYLKDPQITVKAASEESYVRMILKVENKAKELKAIIDTHSEIKGYADFFDGWEKDIWEYIDYEYDEEKNAISFEFRYRQIVGNEVVNTIDASEATEDVKLPPLFTHIVIPGCITEKEIVTLYEFDANNVVDQAKSINVTLEGHAIQAASFEEDAQNNKTAEQVAWEAFKQQNEKQ